MLYFYVFLFCAASLGFIVLALLLCIRGFKRSQPTVVSPEAAQRHAALIYLIRGGELLIAAPIAALIALIGIGFFLTINPFLPSSQNSQAYSVIMLITILLVAAWIVAKSIHRYRTTKRGPFERFWVVDTNSISNFAMIFAALAAHDYYHFMPASPRIFPPNDPGWQAILTNRDLMAFVVFFGLWHLVKVVLIRQLEVNPKPPSNSSGRYVPLNPFRRPLFSPPQ